MGFNKDEFNCKRKSMKNKPLLILLFFTALAFTSNAQSISENALGLRLGGGDGFGAEVSYQRALGGNNRIEGDLGWRSGTVDAFKLTGIYQWVWVLSGNFNWYAGAGAGVGLVETEALLTADGMIGIEYSFLDDGVPILLSLDLNPEIGLINDSGFDMDFAFSIRYQF